MSRAQGEIAFALNHMTCPGLGIEALIEGAAGLGLEAVELRNDIGAASLVDPDQARRAGERARECGIAILSINALARFNIWNDERAREAEALASLASACGARGLVLCPHVDGADRADEHERRQRLETSLSALDDILGRYDLKGFMEPLGFNASTLRFKREAVSAIEAVAPAGRFSLVHDTFHHRVAGETALFAEHTGLLHISGVEKPALRIEEMLDDHRVLVGPDDRIDNVGQLEALRSAGYRGFASFEPFATEVCRCDDPLAAVSESLAYLRRTPDLGD